MQVRIRPFSLALLLLVPASATAQSARDVLEDAAARYEERMEGIENYTVVHDVMGFEATAYHERREVDGRTVFVQAEIMGNEAAGRAPEGGAEMYRTIMDRASHEGMESVDGHETHLISVTDFSGEEMESWMGPPSDRGEWVPERMRMWIDAEQLVPRKMVMEGVVEEGGERHPVTFTAFMEDYREVEGMLHPFRMRIESEGMEAMMDMSEQDMAEMQESMRELQEQLESMPEAQRAMMERMMGGQLERMQEMMGSGAMNFTIEVKELRVNEGPPSGP